MSFVSATPDVVTAAASDLAGIGSSLSAATQAAAAPTMGVVAAGADEVSVALAALFSVHAQSYQAVSAQATAFHDLLVQTLSNGAGAYATAEAASVLPLQPTLNLGHAPTQLLLGQPLFGNIGTGGASTAVAVAGGRAGDAGLLGTGAVGGQGGLLARGGTGRLLFGTGKAGANGASGGAAGNG